MISQDPLKPHEIESVLAQVQQSMNELLQAINTLMKRLEPPASSPRDAYILLHLQNNQEKVTSTQKCWTLIQEISGLLSPDGTLVTLSQDEKAFLLLLFSAPDSEISYEQARRTERRGRDRTPRSKAAMSALVTRLRAKLRKQGLELPLYSVHGIAYYFGALTKIM